MCPQGLLQNSVRALAAFETNSIAQGYLLADEAVKTADIVLLEASAICAGKYCAVFTGSPASVRAAQEAAHGAAHEGLLYDELYLARVHEDVCSALCGYPHVIDGALGVFESYSAIAALELGDALAKRCPVRLIEMRLGRGLGGKSVVSFCGEQAAVEEAIAMVTEDAKEAGLLSDGLVIANPSVETLRAVSPDGPDHRAGCSGCSWQEGTHS